MPSTNANITNALASAMADVLGAAADSGYIRIYDGTQAATADTAIGAQNLLAELRFGADAFPAASNGVLTANTITADSDANFTGTASWARILQSNGTTVLFDCEAGTSGTGVILNSTAIQIHQTVSCSALTYTVTK